MVWREHENIYPDDPRYSWVEWQRTERLNAMLAGATGTVTFVSAEITDDETTTRCNDGGKGHGDQPEPGGELCPDESGDREWSDGEQSWSAGI